MSILICRIVSIDEPLLNRLRDACTQVLKASNNNVLELLDKINSIKHHIQVDKIYKITFTIEWNQINRCFFVSVSGNLYGSNGRSGFRYADSSGNENFLFQAVSVGHLTDLYEETLNVIQSEGIVTVTVENN
jgi:hypothetical protein